MVGKLLATDDVFHDLLSGWVHEEFAHFDNEEDDTNDEQHPPPERLVDDPLRQVGGLMEEGRGLCGIVIVADRCIKVDGDVADIAVVVVILTAHFDAGGNCYDSGEYCEVFV